MPLPRPVSISDIARQLGITRTSVSKALNPNAAKCDLAPATRDRIRQVAQRLGYDPSAQPRWAGNRQLRAIGLVYGREVPWTSSVYDGFYKELALALAQRKYHLLFVPVPWDDSWASHLRLQALQGALLMNPLPGGLAEELYQRRFPTVVINEAATVPLDRVCFDDQAGSRALGRRLAALGHRRITWVRQIVPNPQRYYYEHSSVEERWSGFQAGVAEAGLQAQRIEYQATEDLARQLHQDRPTAVAGYDQAEALDLLRAAWLNRWRVPDDLSVAAGDDRTINTYLAPSLTGVRLPVEEAAQVALRLLFRRIEGGTVDGPQVVTLAETLVERESTAPLLSE